MAAKKSVLLRLLDAYSTGLVLQVLKHLMNYLQWTVLYTSVLVTKKSLLVPYQNKTTPAF